MLSLWWARQSLPRRGKVVDHYPIRAIPRWLLCERWKNDKDDDEELCQKAIHYTRIRTLMRTRHDAV